MESIPSLSASGYLVLGVVALQGPLTTYDLKASVDGSLGYFWTFPRSQLYAQTDKLVAAGLLGADQEESGRRRRMLHLTETGRAALLEWLASVPDTDAEMRDPGLLRLFFSDLVSADQRLALAEDQIERHSARLGVYRQIKAAEPDGEFPMIMRTLEMGLTYEKAAVEFWKSVAEDVRAEV